MSSPLWDLIQFRRRTRTSLVGRIPGTEYGRHRGGTSYLGTPGRLNSTGGNDVVRSPAIANEYDPFDPKYSDSPGYALPDRWDTPHVGSKRLLASVSPILEEPPEDPTPSYAQSVAAGQAVEDLLERIRDMREKGEGIPENLATWYDSLQRGTLLSPGLHVSEPEGGLVVAIAVRAGLSRSEGASLDQTAEELTHDSPRMIAFNSPTPNPPEIHALDAWAPPLEQIVDSYKQLPDAIDPDRQMQMMDHFNIIGPMG